MFSILLFLAAIFWFIKEYQTQRKEGISFDDVDIFKTKKPEKGDIIKIDMTKKK